ncbi:histidine kinase [Actinokineospora sp. PR83]|uniref:sensor histidine kinase n=1 Tax=Actinokineospora sp. PR83 TaxID=2884908 RepID=UPI0027DEE9BE|nr:histidine kinase [Actinokineospora sp. PR83]MCG8914596.1 histidine kinase [Actinokineospora sp. PR83]
MAQGSATGQDGPPGGERTGGRFEPGWWLVRVLGSVFIGATLVSVRPGEFDGPEWAVVAACALCWVAFTLLDTRHPRSAVVVLAVSSALPSALTGPEANGSAAILAGITLLVLASHMTPPAPAILAACGLDVAISATSYALAGRPLGSTAATAAVLLLVTLMGLNRRQYRVQAEQNRRLVEQVRRTQHEQARAAALDERARLARELHDLLAHSLGALSVQLELAEAHLGERGDLEHGLAHVRRSRALAAAGLDEAREAVAALRADVPPLPVAIAALVAGYRLDRGMHVDLVTEGTERALPSAVSVAVLRVAREALTNAAKHAGGTPVAVRLKYGVGDVRLTVRNPLRPGDPAATRDGGHGLEGMRERVALVGGALTAGAESDGDGPSWALTVEVPA